MTCCEANQDAWQQKGRQYQGSALSVLTIKRSRFEQCPNYALEAKSEQWLPFRSQHTPRESQWYVEGTNADHIHDA